MSRRHLGLGPVNVYNSSMNTHLLDQVRKLSIDERIDLVEVIWDSIAVPGAARR